MTTKNPFKKAIFIGAALLAVGLVTSASPVFAEQPEVEDNDIIFTLTDLLEDHSTQPPTSSCTASTNNGCSCTSEWGRCQKSGDGGIVTCLFGQKNSYTKCIDRPIEEGGGCHCYTVHRL